MYIFQEKSPYLLVRAFTMAKNRNFDRNRVRGCNFGSEGGAVLDLRGCSSLPKEEERLREPMR